LTKLKGLFKRQPRGRDLLVPFEVAVDRDERDEYDRIPLDLELLRAALEMLASDDYEIRVVGAHAIGSFVFSIPFGDDRAYSDALGVCALGLYPLMNDRELAVRRAAFRAFVLINPKLVGAWAESCVNIKDVVEALSWIRKYHDHTMRAIDFMADVLKNRPDPAAAIPLARFLLLFPNESHYAVLDALVSIGDKKVIPVIEKYERGVLRWISTSRDALLRRTDEVISTISGKRRHV
jgi:hypothetical protein